MFRKEGNMKMGGFNKFFMLAMSDSVLSCWGEACSHLHVFVIVPLVPARGRNTELLNLQGSWELSVTETPRFSAWWAFARLQTRNSQVFCLLYLHTCRIVRIKPIWLLKFLVIHLCLPKLPLLLSLTFHQRWWFCAALSSSMRSMSCVPWQVFPLVWCSLWLFDNLRMETVVKCGRLQLHFSRSQICFWCITLPTALGCLPLF